MTYYVVVRGPLGVGKSTVSIALAARLAAHRISIDQILEEQRLEEWEGDRIPPRCFLRANDFAVREAEPLLFRGVPVVLEGNFYYESQLDDLEQRLRWPHRILTLEAPLDVCIERDRGRPRTRDGQEPKAGESLGAEATATVFEMVAQVRRGEPIDATGSLEETVTSILHRLSS